MLLSLVPEIQKFQDEVTIPSYRAKLATPMPRRIRDHTVRPTLESALPHPLFLMLIPISLPALGTGVGHVPPPISADAMLKEVVAHLKRGSSSLRRIVFVLYLDDAYRAFTDTLKRLGGAQ